MKTGINEISCFWYWSSLLALKISKAQELLLDWSWMNFRSSYVSKIYVWNCILSIWLSSIASPERTMHLLVYFAFWSVFSSLKQLYIYYIYIGWSHRGETTRYSDLGQGENSNREYGPSDLQMAKPATEDVFLFTTRMHVLQCREPAVSESRQATVSLSKKETAYIGGYCAEGIKGSSTVNVCSVSLKPVFWDITSCIIISPNHVNFPLVTVSPDLWVLQLNGCQNATKIFRFFQARGPFSLCTSFGYGITGSQRIKTPFHRALYSFT